MADPTILRPKAKSSATTKPSNGKLDESSPNTTMSFPFLRLTVTATTGLDLTMPTMAKSQARSIHRRQDQDRVPCQSLSFRMRHSSEESPKPDIFTLVGTVTTSAMPLQEDLLDCSMKMLSSPKLFGETSF